MYSEYFLVDSYTKYQKDILKKYGNYKVNKIYLIKNTVDILDNYFTYLKWTDNLNDTVKFEITKLIMKYISVFHNIHEDEIELALFTNNLIFLFSIHIYNNVAPNI